MPGMSSRTNCALVHRTRESEVFVTEFVQDSDEVWWCTVDAPATHPRIAGAQGVLPAIVALEIQRQGGYIAAHQFGVPLGWRFVILEFAVQWAGQGPRLDPGTGGFRGTLLVEADVTQLWQEKPRRMEYAFQLLNSDAEVAGSGRAVALCLDPSRYAMLRQRSGAVDEPGSALAAPGEVVRVRWNDQDRFLFNRPGDHVVSMALLDAFLNEIASRNPSRSVIGIDTRFYRFGESAHPVSLNISVGSVSEVVQGVFLQDGTVIAEAAATLR